MDIVKSLPVFRPAGFTSERNHDGDFPSPPKTVVFNVHGFSGPKPAANVVPHYLEYWMPPDSISMDLENIMTFRFSQETIVKRGASEGALERVARALLDHVDDSGKEACYVFLGDDIGGAIVKLALVIAARETRYRHIFDAAQAAIFFSTPHRASSTHSMDSTILALIQATYGNLIEDCLSATVNRLSRQLEDINERFSLISHNFGIVSFYQASPLPGSAQAIITQGCATTGLENEIAIPCHLPLRDMSVIMSRGEQAVLQTHMINTKIACWKRFRHFIAVIESFQPTLELDRPVGSHPMSSRIAARCSRDSSLSDWISSKDGPRYLKAVTRVEVDAGKFLNSIALTIRQYPDSLWISCPKIATQGVYGDLQDETWIYASLVLQVLTQQPRAFLHLQHLVSISEDAIRGNLKSWKRRALRLCLKTLIHAPIGAATYGFLAVQTQESAKVLKEINSMLVGTCSRFRLVVNFPRDAPSGLDPLETLEMDFGQEDLEDCLLTSPRSVLEDTSLQILSMQLIALGRPIFIALVWVAFATKPLSLEELDLALALDGLSENKSLSVARFSRGTASRLRQLLPDIVSIHLGRVLLCVSYTKMRVILTRASRSFLESHISPHLYIAQSCVLLLAHHVLKAAEQEPTADPEAVHSHRNTDADSDSSSDLDSDPGSSTSSVALNDGDSSPGPDMEDLAGNGSPPDQEDGTPPWVVGDMSYCQRILAEYAARNWINHYKLAGAGEEDLKDDQPYLTFVGDDANIRKWLELVEYLAQASPLDESRVINNHDTSLSLQERLGITRLESLELLCRLAGRPRLGDTSAERLLLDAAELGDEAALRSLFPTLHLMSQDTVVRALAATSGSIHSGLRAEAAVLNSGENMEMLVKIYLTAQLFGNDDISKSLMSELRSLEFDDKGERWFSDALQQAIDYDDDNIINILLKHDDQREWMRARDGTSWTPVHRAASNGNMVALTQICEGKLADEAMLNQTSPDGRSPLFLASSFGFTDIVEYLIRKKARVNEPNGPLERTALHTASDYGHLGCVKVLLKHSADATAADTEGNFSLHLSVWRGHVSIAELLVEAFPSIPDGPSIGSEMVDSPQLSALQRDPRNVTFEDHPDAEDSDGTGSAFKELDELDDQDSSIVLDEKSSAPLNRANQKGINALFAAANRELSTVAIRLLKRGADPNILGDMGRVTLHVAVKAGSISLIRELLEKGSVINHVMDHFLIPLHFACYRGRPDIVEVLADESDLAAKDMFGRTPLVAASASGYTEVIRSLLSHIQEPDLVPAFIAAVEHGHRDVASFLLDLGCPVDSTSSAGDAALHIAARNNCSSGLVRHLLLRGANPGLANAKGSRPIHLAVCGGFLDTTRLLIDAGASLDIDDQFGESPLSIAIYYEFPAVVRLLLERGARMKLPAKWRHYSGLAEFSWGMSTPAVTEVILEFYHQGKGEDGITPSHALIVAMDRASTSFIKLVLRKLFTSDLQKSGIAGGQAIHYAVENRKSKFLRLILRNDIVKASINQPKTESPAGTPLHLAIRESIDAEALVDILLEHNADPSILSGSWGTTLNEACGLGQFGIAEKLLARLKLYPDVISSVTGKYGTPVQSALAGCSSWKPANDTIEMLVKLKAAGAAVSTTGGWFFTALHAAVVHAPREVISWVTAQDKSLASFLDPVGRTPFHLAIHRGDRDIIQDLSELSEFVRQPLDGSSPLFLWKRQDNQGRSGLHYAAVAGTANPMVQVLSEPDGGGEIKALLRARDMDGWTPLHWACRNGNVDILNALLEKRVESEQITDEGWTPRQIGILHDCDNEFLEKLPGTDVAGEGLPDGAGLLLGSEPCEACFETLRWQAYRCTSESCDVFYLCFKCYKHTEVIHEKGHEFEEINSPV